MTNLNFSKIIIIITIIILEIYLHELNKSISEIAYVSKVMNYSKMVDTFHIHLILPHLFDILPIYV